MKENLNSISSSMKLKFIFATYNEDGKRRRVEVDRWSEMKPVLLQRKTRGSRVFEEYSMLRTWYAGMCAVQLNTGTWLRAGH